MGAEAALILVLKAEAARPRRNRQVQAFYDVIEFFQPAFVLMENVKDILVKQVHQEMHYQQYALLPP